MHTITELLVLSIRWELWQQECFKAVFWQYANNCGILCIKQRKRLSRREALMQKRSVFNCQNGISAWDRLFKPSALWARLGILWTFGTGFFAALLFPHGQCISFIVNITEKCTSKFNCMNLLFICSLSQGNHRYFYSSGFNEGKKLEVMRMKTHQGQWRLSQTGSGLYQHLLTRTPHRLEWAKSKKAITVNLGPQLCIFLPL